MACDAQAAECRWIPIILLALVSGLAARDKPPVPPPAGWKPPEIRCPLGKAPVLDGVVAQGEWEDALVVRQAADPWPHDTMVQKLDVKYDPADLACTVRMKHDGTRLYILCEIADDLVYKLDTEEWVPDKFKDRPKPTGRAPPGRRTGATGATASRSAFAPT